MTQLDSNVTNEKQEASMLAHLHDEMEKQWKKCREEFKIAQRQYSRESIHDLRVALRRYLSLLDLARGVGRFKRIGKVRLQVKKHLDALDELRDVQVQINTIEKLLTVVPGFEEYETYLLTEESKLSDKAMKRLGKLRLNKLKEWSKGLTKAVSKKASNIDKHHKQDQSIAENLDSSFNKVLACKEKLKLRDVNAVHDMRLAFKSFRYKIEALQPVLKDYPVSLLNDMGDFQDKMGIITDYDVLLKSMKKKPKSLDRDTLAELERRIDVQIEDFVGMAGRVTDFWGPRFVEIAAAAEEAVEDKLEDLKLYVFRHGEAAQLGENGVTEDSERPLTRKGKKEVEKLTKGLVTLGLNFDLIMTSPYARAAQTADVVIKEMDYSGALVSTNNLLPEAEPRDLFAEIKEKFPDKKDVLVVGHMPQLGSLVSLLTTGDTSLSLNFKKGAVCGLTISSLDGNGRGTMNWLLNPKHLSEMA